MLNGSASDCFSVLFGPFRVFAADLCGGLTKNQDLLYERLLSLLVDEKFFAAYSFDLV